MRITCVPYGLLIAILGFSFACGQSDGVKNNASNAPEGEVVISGRLPLTAGLSLSSNNALLLWELVGGSVAGVPSEITIAEDGSFSVNVSNQNQTLARLRAAIPGDGTVDRDLLKEALPMHADDIDAVESDSELIAAVSSFIEESERQGGATYLLVSITKTGNRITEAESFQFVGLPTGGANLLGLPSDAIKMNLDLGYIDGTGDEIVAELEATTDILDLSESAIQEFASLSNTLKVIKNYWMNADENGVLPAEITPWFGWATDDLSAAKNKFSAPSSLNYMGAGFYIGVRNIGAGFSEVCPEAAIEDENASRTLLSFVPPAAVTSGNVTIDSDNPFRNTGKMNRSPQYQGVSCFGDDGVYIRNDSSDANSLSYMLGWGNIQGPLPEGIWQLKVDSVTKGNYDLAAAYPMDSDDKPLI